MGTDISIGNQLRAWRHERGLTLREVARRVGVSTVFVGQMERGKCPVPKRLHGRIEDALQLETGSVAALVAPLEERPLQFALQGNWLSGTDPNQLAKWNEEALELLSRKAESTEYALELCVMVMRLIQLRCEAAQ